LPTGARMRTSPRCHRASDCRYFGTVTYNSVTGALAWKGAGYGLAIGSAPVYEFPLWERIRLQTIMELEHPPRNELTPKFAQESQKSYG